ncbi:uncharacterized protein LOC110028428 [Phalaenopsis equestris]|uniref:uncharacterized protein LOC110028428 n=1 Tax=Phalaenopsis equestris TaxID=78828 RepID=UPI0009E6454C|nr:uncharacterized protein LOC110028428 [Phalaenopsis equestris]
MDLAENTTTGSLLTETRNSHFSPPSPTLLPETIDQPLTPSKCIPPRQASCPLLFLFSFAAILLFSYHYHSSIQLPQSESPNHFTFNPRNTNILHHNFSFTVKVLTFNRIESLRRCLRSLAAADYAGDRVNLHILVDHFSAVNGSDALMDGKLEESRRILDLVDELGWVHGEKLVHYRTGNVGLQAQWLEAWWPISDDDFAFIVEDDLEVSLLYYKYLKALILNYYYDLSNYSPFIYGASLQRPRFVAGKHGNKLQVDSETRLFLYQMVGTWGQLLFPKPWKEFRLWYDEHKVKGAKPILQGMVTTGWYKRMGERIWTPWFIKFIHAKGYYNIYTNFLNERALTISHRDAGVNYGKTAGPDSNLLHEQPLDFNIWEMQSLKKLKWYDFCFREVVPWRFIRSYDELGSVLYSMQKQKPVVIVSLYRTPEKMAKNLRCHLKKINMRNVIFIGGPFELISDLARNGYPVIDFEKLINTGSYELVRSEPSRTDKMKEILAKSIIVKRCLELGHETWVIDGNILPLRDIFFELPNPACSFLFAKNLEMVFVKKSRVSSKIWDDDFISKLVSHAGSVEGGDLASTNYKHFAYFARKVLEDSGIVDVCLFDELKFGVEAGADGLNKTIQNGTKMVFWSGNVDLNSAQRWLDYMEMWLIDEDLSCVSVLCHQQ